MKSLEEIVACDQCGKVRTNEPEYTVMQAIMCDPLGWFSSDNEELCPADIAKVLNTSNRTPEYVGWSE